MWKISFALGFMVYELQSVDNLISTLYTLYIYYIEQRFISLHKHMNNSKQKKKLKRLKWNDQKYDLQFIIRKIYFKMDCSRWCSFYDFNL